MKTAGLNQTEELDEALANDELPEGWANPRLEDCVEILDHLRVPVNSDERERRKGSIPYYGATGQVGWIDDYLFDEQLLLLGEDGAPFLDKGKSIAYIIQGKSWVNNHAHVLRALNGVATNQFIKYILDHHDFTDDVRGTTRLKLTQAEMRNISVPLPPLEEQKRIVAKIEELLAEVNRVRARLEKVAKILKAFRQSVLAAACSGRLTEDWREKNPGLDTATNLLAAIRTKRRDRIEEAGLARYREPCQPDATLLPEIPEQWEMASMDQLVCHVTSGSRGWAKYYTNSGPYFIRAENINTDTLSLESAAHVQPPAKAEGRRTYVERDDLLVTITGANVTKSAVVEIPLGEAYVSQHVALIRPAAPSMGKYLYLWTVSPLHGRAKLLRDAYGAGKPGLNLDNIRETPVGLPPIDEQKEIVRRVEALFKLADMIEKQVESATKRAERITQAILAKAFRGELVPTEAELARREARSYEPVPALLERIKQERQEASPRLNFKQAASQSRRKLVAGKAGTSEAFT